MGKANKMKKQITSIPNTKLITISTLLNTIFTVSRFGLILVIICSYNQSHSFELIEKSIELMIQGFSCILLKQF